MRIIICLMFGILCCIRVCAQALPEITWLNDKTFLQLTGGQIISQNLETGEEKIFVSPRQLTPASQREPIIPESFSVSQNGQLVLLFTNTAKVWRYNTRGDYWLLNLKDNSLRKMGQKRPSQSLMFAKLSPDGKMIAFVSNKNIYVEDLVTNIEKALTVDGKDKLINGTFDWVYEEEFFCRDGFRWGPDSKSIAYWQVNATGTRDFYLINNTDSIYSQVKAIEYPKVGQPISSVRIGVVNIADAKTKWMNIPGDPKNNYLVRVEWANTAGEIIVQQLNRKQQVSKLFLCNKITGNSTLIYEEKDSTWIDLISLWDQDYANGGWDWLDNGKQFVWPSEKDGWRHLYAVSRDGKSEQLITKGSFDVIDIVSIDRSHGFVYYLASPKNATQKYLYRSAINGKGEAEMVTAADQPGTHEYKLSPKAEFAFHVFTNFYTPYSFEWIRLSDGKGLGGQNTVADAIKKADKSSGGIEFFKVTTDDGIEMDGWMQKPKNFDPSKKYPVLFFVYTEPWGQEVKDIYGVTGNPLYTGDLAEDGYLYVCIDNRGTPVPKGRAWRKSIYRKIGVLNISDQAKGASQVLKWKFADTSRVAVWGWSGGGNATLGLMFQYPEIYKTGIAISAVTNQLTYDNVYQERYMGDPTVSLEDYKIGSPITYAKNLRGNLLYIHGTGDDNVHYQNAEMLLNELIRYNKQFQFMAYPNRTHSISEGEGTTMHLKTLYSDYLRKNCPPGGR